MADPKGPETGQNAKGAPGARPRSPTLDLSATEVTSDDKGRKAEAPAAGPAAAAAQTSAATGPSKPPAAEPPPAAAKAPNADTPQQQPKPAAAAGATSASAAREPKPAAAVMPESRREGVGLVGMLVSSLAGAALALLGVSLFGQKLIGPVQSDASRVSALESKLAAVGGDVAALRADIGKMKPADTASIDARLDDLSKTLDAAGGRIGGFETELKALSERAGKPAQQDQAIPILAGRIDGLELRFQNAPSPQELAVLVGRVAGVEARFKEMPGKDALADLTVRLDDLGDTVDTIGQKIGAATAPISSRVDQIATALKERPKGDLTARLVVALGALDQALGEGRPFAAELTAAKAASGENAELASLEGSAAKGLPTREALGAELAEQIAKLAPVKDAPSGSVLERFVASAGAVVKITPQEGSAGSDPSALRARVASLGSAGDIEGALAARGSLDEAARAATDDWARRASARVAAENAIGSARAAALARLTSND